MNMMLMMLMMMMMVMYDDHHRRCGYLLSAPPPVFRDRIRVLFLFFLSSLATVGSNIYISIMGSDTVQYAYECPNLPFFLVPGAYIELLFCSLCDDLFFFFFFQIDEWHGHLSPFLSSYYS